MKKRTTFNKGLSLVEVLFAAAVLGIVLAAMASLMNKSLNQTTFSAKNATANNLAQEALEKIRNLRDTLTWKEFFENYDGFYCLDQSLNLTPVEEANCLKDCAISSNSIYQRCVSIKNLNEKEKEVKVTVWWLEQNKSHQYQAATVLSKWD